MDFDASWLGNTHVLVDHRFESNQRSCYFFANVQQPKSSNIRQACYTKISEKNFSWQYSDTQLTNPFVYMNFDDKNSILHFQLETALNPAFMILGHQTNETSQQNLDNQLVKAVLVKPSWLTKYVPIYLQYGVRLKGITVFIDPLKTNEIILRYLDFGQSRLAEAGKSWPQSTKIWEMRIT